MTLWKLFCNMTKDVDTLFTFNAKDREHAVDFIQGDSYVKTEPKTSRSRRTIALPQIAVNALAVRKGQNLEEGKASL